MNLRILLLSPGRIVWM